MTTFPVATTLPAAGSPRALASRFLARSLRALLTRWFREAPVRVVLWDGAEVVNHPRPAATVTIRDAATVARLLLKPELAFGEGYARGDIEVEGDLVALVEPFQTVDDRMGLLQRAARVLDPPRSNRLESSRENVHAHYDLGNDFYRLWLDDQMVYTCAYYRTPDDTLEAAQRAKLEHVCRKLSLRPGERVLEAGCGWGGLALHMAEHHGVHVTAYNVAAEQLAWARERARERGLSRRVEFVDGDYREATGRFDAVVSVGMLEHVGREHYGELGELLDRALERDGRGLLHFIGRPRPCPTNAWVERHIFPGAYIPSLAESLEVLEPRGLAVLDVENLRLHYARTLAHWLERFERRARDVEREFDATFVRTWRLYLASSLASFRTGSLQLFQVLFARPARDRLELTRAHLYRDDPGLAAEEPLRWNARTS